MLRAAVLDAARTPGEELLQKLQTVSSGLTEAEAEERARVIGPNAVAQEKPQTWPIRLLKIIRNPLVILLTTLSAVSFATGDARAGTVMAMMVVSECGTSLPPGGKSGCSGSQAQGHDSCDCHGCSRWRA